MSKKWFVLFYDGKHIFDSWSFEELINRFLVLWVTGAEDIIPITIVEGDSKMIKEGLK